MLNPIHDQSQLYRSPVVSYFIVQNMRFGLFLGRLAVLKLLNWVVKHATFEGILLIS